MTGGYGRMLAAARLVEPIRRIGEGQPEDAPAGSIRYAIEGGGIVMDFGTALTALRNGSRVSRKGWNGKGMWLVLCKGGTGDASAAPGVGPDLPLLPFIAMKTAQDEYVPWLASQSDLLAFDWGIV